MTLSRAHFQLIADTLRDVRPTTSNFPSDDHLIGALHQWQDTVKAMSRTLAATNPRFDRRRFENACGLDEVTW